MALALHMPDQGSVQGISYNLMSHTRTDSECRENSKPRAMLSVANCPLPQNNDSN